MAEQQTIRQPKMSLELNKFIAKENEEKGIRV